MVGLCPTKLVSNLSQTENLKYLMKRNQNHHQLGFTVVELLVVFIIMVMLSSLVVINWNSQKPNRSLVIAQNELITNIRKVQSYAVSSRNISAGVSAKYYLMKFVLNSNDYTVEAIDANGQMVSSPIEQVNLPTPLTISQVSLADSSGSTTDYSCAYAIFSVVYGKTYFYGGRVIDGDFCTAADMEALVADPVTLARQSVFDLILSISYPQTGAVKSIRMDSQTGRVEPFVVSGKIGG